VAWTSRAVEDVGPFCEILPNPTFVTVAATASKALTSSAVAIGAAAPPKTESICTSAMSEVEVVEL
jgi:hypothetical protein